MANDQVLLEVFGVWKKFCRDFRKSLVYGVKDIASEILLEKETASALRPGEFWALRDVNFSLKRGQTLGILGLNGAGKSSLLKLISGINKLSRGRINTYGTLQALMELTGAFSPVLSGRENISISSAVLGMGRTKLISRIDEIIEFSELGDFIDAPVGTYSTGMRARLSFSIASAIEPDILALDEVLTVGDIKFQSKCLDRIAELRKKASGVIFVSHSLSQIQRLCTHCLILDRGEVLAYGETSQVLDIYIKQVGLGQKNPPGFEEVSDGIRLVGCGIEQNGESYTYNVRNEPFKIWYDLNFERPFEAVGLDLILFNEAHQMVVKHSQSHPELANTKGGKKISISYPNLNLPGGTYFPYLAVSNTRTLQKLLKYTLPTGFNVEGRSSEGFLSPQIEVECS